MRSFVLGAVSALALTGGANAADMYRGEGGSLKDGPIYVEAPSWGGWYVGVNGGYAFSDSSDAAILTFRRADGTDLRTIKTGVQPEGAFGGAQLGYNFQSGFLGFGPRFVFGIETDFQGGDINDKSSTLQVVTTPGIAPVITNRLGTTDVDVSLFGTVRGRIGYAFGSTLVYATGGFAYGEVHATYSFDDGKFAGSARHSEIDTGYSVGGGIEQKISPQWSVKAEYQYIDLGSVSASAPVAGGTPPDVYNLRGHEDITFHTVRAGLNYHTTPAYQPLK